MTAIAHVRGWECYYNGNKWLYVDNNQSINPGRACVRCGICPTSEGYDACMGYVPGAKSVCCGHGVEEPHIIMRLAGEPMEDK